MILNYAKKNIAAFTLLLQETHVEAKLEVVVGGPEQ